MLLTSTRSRIVAIGAAAGLAIGLTLPVSAAGASSSSPTTLSLPAGSSAASKSIVLLRDDETGMAARSASRSATLKSEEAPFESAIGSAGGKVDSAGSQLPFVVASLTSAQRSALSANPDVAAVVPDEVIPNPAPELPVEPVVTSASTNTSKPATAPSICGTESSPEVDPEALSAINASAANALGYDGAGVSVAYIAGPIDTTINDFQRNARYASAGSPTGSPVVTNVDFAGDPPGTPAGDVAGESFLDASSIAAQGNTVYNLDDFVNTSHKSSLPNPCDITVTGAAPGASVTGLDVFSNDYDTTESNFIQAIDYAVANGVKVLNESFGSNNFPDTALDVTKIADDDAVAAGVTVVVSSGDSGVTSTIGSPATDPNLISVGATTTFRAYQQDFLGGINATVPTATNGTWLDNNISSISSGGFAMNGANTVDLVAPGDENWALCSTNVTLFPDCTNENGDPSGLEVTGGTSESAPLTAAAAADVIQAYASTHGGTDPTPALIKQILMSTATDIDAPAEQQGAGLLNVLGAVKEALSLPGTSAPAASGLLVSPGQINITQAPYGASSNLVSLTNTGTQPLTVDLSTRALGTPTLQDSGSFCLNPSSVTSSCGPPTANSMKIWSGVTEVYQEERFTVPALASPSRLNFSADYPLDNPEQGSLLHVALYDPTGAYAGYSFPQGLADYANIQVANPAAGTWTAVFFTEKNGATAGGTGTSGTIGWQATTSQYVSAGTIAPSALTIAPGRTSTAVFIGRSSAISGDAAQSIVLHTVGGATTTIPVTIRTTVATSPGETSTFSGVLTGGNGRGNPTQTNSYAFNVPNGMRDVEASASFADPGDGVTAFLLDPQGEAVASSSNITFDSGGNEISTGAVNIYKDAPQSGTWTLVLDWLEPVSGSELSEPFTGTIGFNQVQVSSTLSASSIPILTAGHTYTFDVTIKNTGASPQAYFLDPRTTGQTTVPLADINGSDQDMSLPLPPGVAFPIYTVPTDTSGIIATLNGSLPVTFDTEPFTGDPDLSPAVPAPGVTEGQGDDSAGLSFTTAGEVMPGFWYLNPSEIGPYTDGQSSGTASSSFWAVTEPFDPTVAPSTGDLWSYYNGLSSGFDPAYVQPGQSVTIPFQVTPTAASGSVVSGVINVDDTFQVNVLIGAADSGGDELAAIPYTYQVAGHSH